MCFSLFPDGAMAGDDVVTNKRRKSYITNCAVSALVFPSLPTYFFVFFCVVVTLNLAT